MKFKIYWLEYHNPSNWTDCPKLENKRDKILALPFEKRNYDKLNKIREKIEKNGIKNIIESLPTKRWGYDPNENDGWIEVECLDTFKAKNIEEAKKKTSEYDIPTEVFTVFDDKGEILFTEEDIE